MKILFVGDLNKHGRSFQRYETLRGMNYDVVGLSHTPISSNPGFKKRNSLFFRFMWKIRLPLDLTNVNKKIIEAINDNNFDIVWIEKGNNIRPKTLKSIKEYNSKIKLVSCSEDDMYAKHNRSHYYENCLSHYDIVFTTKTYNLKELKLLGAKNTELFLDSYNDKLHKPISLTKEDKKIFSSKICFVGTFEEERALSLLYLANNGIHVIVWGNGWEGWQNKSPNLEIKGKPVYNEAYVKAICGAEINLCFLRKVNRDEVTSRSIEIPACGGFMIAERTKRHKDFFEEDKEAVFFDSNEELLNKVKYYLNNKKEREKIAKAGRKRCLDSKYSMREQLFDMIKKIRN